MKKIMTKVKNKIKELCIKLKFHLVFPLSFFGKIDKYKCVVCAFSGRGYIDNPKNIADELYRSNPNYKIVCFVKKFDNTIPNYVIQKKYTPYHIIRELSTSKIWIDDERKIYPIHKKKEQIYIQTWHGGLFSLKRIEKDVEDKLEKYYVKYAKKDSKRTDVFISDSNVRTELYRKSFWYNGEILQVGQPRNDIMYEKEKHIEIINNVYKKLNIDKKYKILLYAPTIRKKFEKDIYDMNFDTIRNTLKEKFASEWIILVKLHPAIANRANELELDKYESVIDVSTWTDMQELLIASDILITDYSSTLFDYLILEKKAFIFAKDMQEYEKDRGHYFNFRTLPISISESSDELQDHILNFEESKYIEGVRNMLNQCGIERGKASIKVVEWINNKIREGN